MSVGSDSGLGACKADPLDPSPMLGRDLIAADLEARSICQPLLPSKRPTLRMLSQHSCVYPTVLRVELGCCKAI